MIINLSSIPTPQLVSMRQILVAGVPSKAESNVSTFAQDKERLCHESPPKGYTKDKASYGDSECYRYPLDTKARCLAAWRYVHHEDNKAILGDKFKNVQANIKNYAKEHYDLDLQVSTSDELNWSQVFVEYYDSETMGERCDCIVLDESKEEKDIMENTERIEALEREVQTLKEENESLSSAKSEFEEKASQVDTLTQELTDYKEELESLREFKRIAEEAAEKAERIKTIKTMLEEAEIDTDVEAESEYWLGMSDDILKLTISKMGEMKKGAKASASIKVPQLPNEDINKVEVVRDGLRKMKSGEK